MVRSWVTLFFVARTLHKRHSSFDKTPVVLQEVNLQSYLLYVIRVDTHTLWQFQKDLSAAMIVSPIYIYDSCECKPYMSMTTGNSTEGVDHSRVTGL